MHSRDSSVAIRSLLLPVLLLAASCDNVPTLPELMGKEDKVDGEVPDQQVQDVDPADAAGQPTTTPPTPKTPQQIVDEFNATEPRMRTNAQLQALTQLDPEFLQQITVLDLENSQVNDPGAGFLSRFPHLEEVNLTGTAVTNDGMSDVAAAEGLRRVYLDRMIIDGQGLQKLAGHRQMEELSLSNTPVTDGAFIHLANMKDLQVLRVSGTRTLQGNGFNELVEKNVMSNLRELEASGTGFGFYGLKNLKKLNQLEVLRLSDAQVSDQILPGIAACRNLRILDLRQNPIGNAGIKLLARLDQLEELYVGGCIGVSDEGLPFLRGLKNLKTLDLNGCRCRTSAVQELKQKHLPNTEIRFDNQVF